MKTSNNELISRIRVDATDEKDYNLDDALYQCYCSWHDRMFGRGSNAIFNPSPTMDDERVLAMAEVLEDFSDEKDQ